MRNKQSHVLAIAFVVIISAPVRCYAQDVPVDRQKLGMWVMNYYKAPTPAEFVQRVKQMSAAGLLHNPKPGARPDANVMFLGKVMAANEDQIPEWMKALESLPAVDMKILKRAVWYSGTHIGKAWLIENGEAELANGPRPALLSGKQALQMQPYQLDQLWEWFFATGEAEPVARIISLYSLAHQLPDEKTLGLLSPPAKSDDATKDQIQRYNYRLLRPALWSTTSLAMHHERVYEILKQSKHEHPKIKAWVGQIIRIAEANRKKSRPKTNAGSDTPRP